MLLLSFIVEFIFGAEFKHYWLTRDVDCLQFFNVVNAALPCFCYLPMCLSCISVRRIRDSLIALLWLDDNKH